MSVAQLLKQNFMEGEPFFMTLYLTLWILVIIFSVLFVMNFKSKSKDLGKLKKMNTRIMFIGGFGVVFSTFYWLIGMHGALSALEMAQDISLELVLKGFKASLIAPIYSLFLFMVSGFVWLFFRNKLHV
jgi:hypothetical protein